jgi:hypothetical protein
MICSLVASGETCRCVTNATKKPVITCQPLPFISNHIICYFHFWSQCNCLFKSLRMSLSVWSQSYRLFKSLQAMTCCCGNCNKSFRSQRALAQHFRDSTSHSGSSYCEACDWDLKTKERFQKHLLSSPRHAPSFDCRNCGRPFGKMESLQQHIRDSQDPNCRYAILPSPLQIIPLST